MSRKAVALCQLITIIFLITLSCAQNVTVINSTFYQPAHYYRETCASNKRITGIVTWTMYKVDLDFSLYSSNNSILYTSGSINPLNETFSYLPNFNGTCYLRVKFYSSTSNVSLIQYKIQYQIISTNSTSDKIFQSAIHPSYSTKSAFIHQTGLNTAFYTFVTFSTPFMSILIGNNNIFFSVNTTDYNGCIHADSTNWTIIINEKDYNLTNFQAFTVYIAYKNQSTGCALCRFGFVYFKNFCYEENSSSSMRSLNSNSSVLSYNSSKSISSQLSQFSIRSNSSINSTHSLSSSFSSFSTGSLRGVSSINSVDSVKSTASDVSYLSSSSRNSINSINSTNSINSINSVNCINCINSSNSINSTKSEYSLYAINGSYSLQSEILQIVGFALDPLSQITSQLNNLNFVYQPFIEPESYLATDYYKTLFNIKFALLSLNSYSSNYSTSSRNSSYCHNSTNSYYSLNSINCSYSNNSLNSWYSLNSTNSSKLSIGCINSTSSISSKFSFYSVGSQSSNYSINSTLSYRSVNSLNSYFCVNSTGSSYSISSINSFYSINSSYSKYSVNSVNSNFSLGSQNSAYSINSESSNNSINSKNSFMSINSVNCTKCINSTNSINSINSINSTNCTNCTNAVNSINVYNDYKADFSQPSKETNQSVINVIIQTGPPLYLISLAAIPIVAITVLLIIRHRRKRVQILRDSQNQQPSMDVIKQKQMKKQELEQEMKQCSICLEIYISDKKTLRCRHVFHRDCIRQWRKRNNLCPLCRREILQRL